MTPVEEELRERAEHYRLLVENQNEFVLRCSPDLRIRYMNPALARIFAGAPAVPEGASLLERISDPALALQLQEAIASLRQPPHSLVLELPYLDASGAECWCEWSARGLLNAQGELEELVVVGRDVTERVHLQRELARRMRQLTDAQTVARLGSWELDIPSGRLEWSDETYRIFDHEKNQGSPDYQSFLDCIHPDDKDLVDRSYRESLQAHSRYEVAHRIVCRDSSIRWVMERGSHFHDGDGNPLRSIGTVQDISESVRIEEERKRWQVVYDNSIEGVMITDAQSRIVDVNPSFTAITGFTREQALGRTPAMLRSARHDEAFYKSIWDSIRSSGRWQGEIWNAHRDGLERPMWLGITAVTDNAGAVSSYIGIFSDISELKQTQMQLERLASHDTLTDLPNRTLIADRLRHAMEHSLRQGSSLAVLFIDLDGFKNINDTLGHAIGDRLLVAVARRLGDRMRHSDSVGRLGGDEFLIVLEQVREREDVARISTSVINELMRPFDVDEHTLFAGASIGIAMYPGDGLTAQELIRNADTAMYRAKQDGKSTFSFYDAQMTVSARQRLTLEGRLRRALGNDEFHLVFQPKISLADGRVRAAEALIRWQSPDLGMVAPDVFIPVAEANGLILPIGEWVMQQSCKAMRELRDSGLDLGHIALNVSALQLQRGRLLQLVMDAIGEQRLAPADLEVEVTESLLIREPEKAAHVLGGLRSLGVRLALDDFGTGWSSLGSLKRFPFTALKIDRGFISGIGRDSCDEAIVRAVVAMGKNLQLEVVAEGVESAGHAAFAAELGCDFAQGYHYSEPVTLRRFAQLLQADAAGLLLPASS
jgi:diguanylate cyclase (GGDEF)-like protein/PAS domain S-box-containing protein